MSDLFPKRRSSPADVAIPNSGIYLLESHHAETFHMEMGRWPFHKLCWLPVGRGLLELPGGSVPIGRDDLLLLPTNTEHRFVDNPSEPLTLVIACISDLAVANDDAVASVFCDLCQRYPPGRPLRAANAFHRSAIRDAFKHLLREQSSRAAGHDAAIRAGLANLLIHMLRGCTSSESVTSGHEQALDGVLDFLEVNFYKPIQLRDLADQCDVSTRRFTDLFRKRTGTTLVDYLNRKRIAQAKERLRETGHIAYACYESGFQDIAYFYRVFKKYTGKTPGEYMKSSYSN